MLTNNMKWKTVLQNLLYFMHDLLPAAYSHGNWTKDGVDRAISWGSYCEKIAKQASQQHGTLHDSFLHIVEKYDWILSFRQLQNARTYLFKFLTQNQLIDKDIKIYINEKALEALEPTTVEELHKEASQQVDFQRQFMGLCDKNEKYYLRFQTRLMLEAANGLSNEQLSTQLKQVITSPGGLEVLIEALTSQKPERTPSRSLVLVIKWLEDILQADESTLYSCVLTQFSTIPTTMLCQLLTMYPTYLSVLLLALKREAKKLKPSYGDDKCIWVPLDSSRCLLTYDCLVTICGTLLADPKVAHLSRKQLLSWGLEDGGMIWNDVIKDINTEY